RTQRHAQGCPGRGHPAQCGEGQDQAVVQGGPGQVLDNDPPGATGHDEGADQAVQAITEQYRVGTGLGQVGGAAHGNTDIGGSQHRHVVDAVTEHQYTATLGMQLAKYGELVIGGKAAAC